MPATPTATNIEFSMTNGSTATILVQDMNGSGSVSCEILKNGQPWKQAVTTTQYGIATCAGLVGFD